MLGLFIFSRRKSFDFSRFTFFNFTAISTNFTYGKKQKLKSRKLIDALFKQKQAVNAFPVKLFYVFVDESDFPVKAGVGVSARNFKKAADRNRIKRLLRESYRLNKNELLQLVSSNNKKMALFFLYIDKEMPDYSTINNSVKTAIQKLIKQVENIK